MIPSGRKLLAFSLAGVLSTQPAITPASETNFWRNRQQTTTGAVATSADMFAAIPTPMLSDRFSGASGMSTVPIDRAALPDPIATSDAGRLAGLLPVDRCSIRELHSSPSSKTPPIVLIQDVHLNSEAQKNISGVLETLLHERRAGVIGIEGAFSPLDFTRFRAFDPTVRKDVAA